MHKSGGINENGDILEEFGKSLRGERSTDLAIDWMWEVVNYFSPEKKNTRYNENMLNQNLGCGPSLDQFWGDSWLDFELILGCQSGDAMEK